jgi:hypothetical protein
VVLEVPESGDDVEAVGDGVASAALLQYLSVLSRAMTPRARLGLSRKGMEAAARKHIEASGWMRDHLTNAVGLHVADEPFLPNQLFTETARHRENG